MFIHKLGGSWLDHPFWSKSFKLENPALLKMLRNSAVKEVIIDTEKGLDIAEPDTVIDLMTQSLLNKSQLPKIILPVSPETSQPVKSVGIEEERDRARSVLSNAKNAVASMFNEVRMGNALNSEIAVNLVEEISASVARNSGALISLARLKNKDDYTYMHSVAVCALMIALGRSLKLTEDEVRQAGLAGLLHDIGKSAISPDILNKPDKLTDAEFDEVKLHPSAGHFILIGIEGLSPIALDVCLHHHEKIDGSGYPKGLTQKEISIYAKMGAVCDVYDAVTSNRPYKEGWEPSVSLQRMARWTTHFDGEVFQAFVKSVGIFPIGSLVKLNSETLAVVLDQKQSLLKPVVKAFYSTKANSYIHPHIIDLSDKAINTAIVGHEDPIAWGFSNLSDLWSK